MQRKSVVGTRSSLLWLLILAVVVLLTAIAVVALVIRLSFRLRGRASPPGRD